MVMSIAFSRLVAISGNKFIRSLPSLLIRYWIFVCYRSYKSSSNMQQVQRGRPRQQFNQQNNNNNNNRFVGQNRQNFRPKNMTNQINTSGINTKSTRDAVIQRNLQHMQQVAEKKRLAQEHYYNKGTGRSPLVKSASGPFVKQESSNNRFSVQNRLGNRNNNTNNTTNTNVRPNRFPNNNQNKNTNNKTIFVRRNNNAQPNGGLRSDKLVRVQNFQQKRIRQNPNANGAIKTLNQAGKVVYLTPIGKGKPSNYTVRVDNNDRKHHVTKELNPKLQKEIMLIQNKSSRQMVMPHIAAPLQMEVPSFDPVAMDRLPTVATSRTLHERFSMI